MRTAVAIWHMLRYCINQSQVAAGTAAMVASVPVTGTGDSMPRMPVNGRRDCLACQLPASEAWSLQCQQSHDCINQSQLVPARQLWWLACRLPARETGQSLYAKARLVFKLDFLIYRAVSFYFQGCYGLLF